VALRRPDTSDYRLAPAEYRHLDEIARIERESFPVPWKREFFESELSESFRYARVLARSGSGPPPEVGGYLFAISLYDEFHVNKIATDSRVRQLGYGRMLLEDALARGRAVRAAAVTLEVRVSNAPAREFYRSYGFREAYRRRAYYQDGEDALALVLPLEAPGEPDPAFPRR
jgi:ribosomal-protein-alanine N-acetyltransferase